MAPVLFPMARKAVMACEVDEEATDCESKEVAGAGACSGVDRRKTIRKPSSRPSEHDFIDLISDNDSAVESAPKKDIKRSQVKAANSSTDGDDGSSEMESHDELSTPRKAEACIQMCADEGTSGTEPQNKKVWIDSACEFSPMGEQKNSGSPSTLKKRSASEVAKDAEALNCKKPKEGTPGTALFSDGPLEATARSPPATAASTAASMVSKSRDPIETTEPGTEIGSCIYAQWDDGGWHFATIYDVKRGPTPASTRYSVFFHDGDTDDAMAREQIETMKDLERIRIEKGLPREHFSPPPLKRNIAQKLEAKLKAKNVPLSVAIEAMKNGNSNTKTDDKFLVGRTFKRAWSDLDHKRKVLYGKVVGYEEDVDGDVTSCTVHYTESTRALMNAFDTRCGTSIPESESVRPEMAIGACLCYEEQHPPEHPLRDFMDLPFHWDLLTPYFVREEVVDGLPRVTMIHRGYKLELSVGDSSIAGAGKGVFLSCTPVVRRIADDEQNAFTLAPGELLDIGIYAPLNASDRKTEAVFTTKNFIHSLRSEEWAFGYSGHHFDTTDDITGDLRADTKARIQAYVNESNDEEEVCVYACNDPENCVHYMLGQGKVTQRKFSMPADGRKREIFVDYGEAYEKVRVRKGYSFLPMAEQKLIEKELENVDVATILHMNEFAASEVEQASNFLFDLFTGDCISEFTEKVIERALICAAVLRRRMRDLCLEDDAKSSSTGDLALLNQSSKVVSQILKLSKGNVYDLAQLHAQGDVNGLLKAILDRQHFSAEQRNELSDLL